MRCTSFIYYRVKRKEGGRPIINAKRTHDRKNLRVLFLFGFIDGWMYVMRKACTIQTKFSLSKGHTNFNTIILAFPI